MRGLAGIYSWRKATLFKADESSMAFEGSLG
jgi:hypothetical protein